MASPYDICRCGHKWVEHVNPNTFCGDDCPCTRYRDYDGEEPRYGDVSVAEESERMDRIQRELK